jgi:hypothetical protein
MILEWTTAAINPSIGTLGDLGMSFDAAVLQKHLAPLALKETPTGVGLPPWY